MASRNSAGGRLVWLMVPQGWRPGLLTTAPLGLRALRVRWADGGVQTRRVTLAERLCATGVPPVGSRYTACLKDGA
jgi:hypothetical protein